MSLQPESEDLKGLRRLIFQEQWTLKHITISFAPDMSAEVELVKNADIKKIKSSEPDYFFFVAQQRVLPDRNGKHRFFQVDIEKYEKALDRLIDLDGVKLKSATQRVLAGNSQISYPEADSLLTRIFVDGKRDSADIEKLSGCLFEIDGLFTVRAKILLEKARSLEKRLPTASKLREEIDRALLNTLIPTLEERPLEILKIFRSWINLSEQDRRLRDQAQYHNWLFAMLVARGSAPGPESISYLLDIYRRFSELTRGYIQALLNATEKDGGTKPQGFGDEVAALAARGFPTISKIVDPRIRHSESHLNSEILPGNRVRINADIGSVDYSFEEIAEMTRLLKEEVVPALFISFSGVESVIVPLMLKKPATKLFLVKELQKSK